MKLSNGMLVLSIPNLSSLKESQKVWWNKWIEALEGGKYKQGRCQLNSGDGRFCCLGVVQDLIKDEIGCRWEGLSFMDSTKTYCATGYLIYPSQDFLGIPTRVGFEISVVNSSFSTYTVSDIKRYGLDQLNDSGATFLEIAKILRKALEGGLNT